MSNTPLTARNLADKLALRRVEAALTVTVLDLKGYPGATVCNAGSLNLRPWYSLRSHQVVKERRIKLVRALKQAYKPNEIYRK